MSAWHADLEPTRLMRCLNCHKQRVCDYGICRPCADQPPADGESPHALTGRWVPNGRGTFDYVEAVAS